MNLLVFTSLWPNRERPHFSPFIKHRIQALARVENMRVRVVAPVPYFPRSLQPSFLPGHWLRDARVPDHETIDGLETWHPRHLVTPKLGMMFYSRWMANGAEALVRRLITENSLNLPVDLLDAHYVYPDGHAAVLLGQRLNLPVVITARGTDINLFSRMPMIRPMIRNALEKAAGVIAVSEALKQRMVELGIAPEKIAVIRNGVDRNLFFPVDRGRARRKLGIPDDARVVLTVSALVPLKGIDRLIEAVGLAPDRQLQFYIVGEGPERHRLQAQVAAKGLAGRVHLIGAKLQSELREWYSAADLFCLASHREGCPNVVIEAMACGLPVVAADVGGLKELISDPSYGCIAPFSTAESIASEIDSALGRGWDRNWISASGAARSWDDVAADILNYYASRGF